MNWIFYGLIFVGVGVWNVIRDKRSRGVHVHRCPKCCAEWQHAATSEYPTARAWVDAHTCPKCGAEGFEIERHGSLPAAPPAPAAPPLPRVVPAAAPPAPPAPPAAPLVEKKGPTQ